MKKKIILILCFVCVIALAAFFALQGGHDHAFSTEWTSDGTQHWHACSCGERQDVTTHVYDREVKTDAYRVSGSACEESYYKSCVCGAKGTDVFVASVNHTYPAADASEGIKWEWEAKAEGGYNVKLTISCTNASCTHSETIQITDVKVEKVDPTQDQDGSITYTVTHTVGSITYTSTKVDALHMADTLVEEIDAILFEELPISSVQESVLVLYNAYLSLSADQQELVTNADKLMQALEIINAIRMIGNMELSFTSAATVRLGQTLKLSVNAKDYNGIAPTITYTVVSGNGTIENDVLSVSDVGSIVVKAVIRYGDYPASVIIEQEIKVAGCEVKVQVSLPSGLKYLMDKVVVKIGDQTAKYDASKGAFYGEAVPGETKVTATLIGFTSASKTLNVKLDSSNSVKLTIKNVVYGPAGNINGYNPEFCTWDVKNNVIVTTESDCDTFNRQSYYKIADGLTGVNTFISATINMKDTTEVDNNRGAGLVFASTKDAVYGIILKPGQGTIALVKGKEQDMNKNGLNSDLKNVTLYNDSKVVTSNGRVEIVALQEIKGDKTYDCTAKLTVVRINTNVYVLVDDVVYASFYVAELKDVAGGFGVTNFGHDKVTFSDISYSTNKQAAINAATVSVKNGNLQGVTVVVSGSKLGDRYLKGTEVTLTFTPATGKDYLYYSNGEALSGGNNGANGAVTYQLTAAKDVTLTAKQVQKYNVSVEVELPENLADLLDRVVVSSGDSNFTYNETTGKFEGRLIAGEHTVTATLTGLVTATGTVTVAADGENTTSVSITEMLYGPGEKLGSGVNGEWTMNGNQVVFNRGAGDKADTSWYPVAKGLTVQKLLISANVNLGMGTMHKSDAEGAGFVIARTENATYSIILKPGQGTIVLAKDTTQTDVVTEDNITVYNGASVNDKRRVNCPALQDYLAKGEYSVDAKLTVVRQNADIYVWVDNVLYAKFHIAELENKSGEFGLLNFNHDVVQYADLVVASEQSVIEDAVTVKVEQGELDEATLTVNGEKWNDRYLLGTELTVTFTPAEGKDYLYYSNGTELTGGNYGANGAVTYEFTAAEDVTLTAKQVQKYNASVDVELPENLANLLDRVVVSSGDSNFTYNETTGKFEGSLIAGDHTVTATLPGLVTATGTVTVAADGENTTTVSISEMLYGPGEKFGSSMNGSWAISEDKLIFTRGEGGTADTSWYPVASGLKVQNLLISSKITYVVGTHKADYEGGGFVVAKTNGDDYSVILKPGQGTIVLMKEGDQNNAVALKNITTYNGATVNENNGRVNCPALQSIKGKNEYNFTAELTVLRQNADIYVWVDDVLYAKFHVDALKDIDSGFGLLDCNHDSLEYADLSIITEQSVIENAVTVKVEQGELKGATVTVSGEKWNDRYLLGTKLTVTFTPAEGKEYLYYSNGTELTGGTAGENGSVSYVVLTKQDLVLTADDVTKYAVNVDVTLPEQLSNLLSKVQVTAPGGTFAYNAQSDKFEGKLLPGVHTITATLPGFSPKSVDYTVTETGANEAQITIALTDVVVNNPAPDKSTWTYDSATNILTMVKIGSNNSTRFEFATALPTTQAVISADITYTSTVVGANAGGGIYFACADKNYGIALKPGQTGVCFVTEYTQTSADSMMAYTVLYNGTVKEEYSRFHMPAFDSMTFEPKNYAVTMNLTVVRQNKEVRVFVNGKLYMQITVADLEGKEVGFGFFNTGHDELKFENITYATTDAAIEAVFDAATVTVENGELNGATTSVTGQQLNGKYITGENVAVTFTPAAGKEYIYKANGDVLSGGTVGANGSVTFIIPANENIVLSAEDVTKYAVNVTVNIPDALPGMLSKVQITAEGGSFAYNAETGKFEGKLLPGEHTISAALPGFESKSTTCTVAENDNNTAEITITMDDMKYGDVVNFSGYNQDYCTWNVNNNVIVTTQSDCTGYNRQSCYEIADGLTGVNSFISATINFKDNYNGDVSRGAGLVFAVTDDGVYGIILKPGQGTITLVKGKEQDMNKNGLNSDLRNVAYYNGASVNTGNGRVNCPALADTKDDKTYDHTATLTVIRRNTLIYVLVDDVLYARFTVDALDGVAGGFGVTNFGHDEVTYSNLSLSTDASAGESLIPVEHDVKVNVTIPANVANLLEKVKVTTERGYLAYNATDKVFEGRLPAGTYTVTASLAGFTAKTATLQVAENGANEAQITIALTDVVVNNPAPTKSTWTYDSATNILTMQKIGDNNSTMFEFANALPTTQAVISADITFTTKGYSNCGAGIYFACADKNYGIALKPGQTGICYMTAYSQASVSGISTYNGVTVDTSTRLDMPAFDDALESKTEYETKATLTVVRQNTKVRVFVNGTLYLEFTVSALENKEVGFGFFNTGHYALKFENITYNTTDEAVQAAFAVTE